MTHAKTAIANVLLVFATGFAMSTSAGQTPSTNVDDVPYPKRVAATIIDTDRGVPSTDPGRLSFEDSNRLEKYEYREPGEFRRFHHAMLERNEGEKKLFYRIRYLHPDGLGGDNWTWADRDPRGYRRKELSQEFQQAMPRGMMVWEKTVQGKTEYLAQIRESGVLLEIWMEKTDRLEDLSAKMRLFHNNGERNKLFVGGPEMEPRFSGPGTEIVVRFSDRRSLRGARLTFGEGIEIVGEPEHVTLDSSGKKIANDMGLHQRIRISPRAKPGQRRVQIHVKEGGRPLEFTFYVQPLVVVFDIDGLRPDLLLKMIEKDLPNPDEKSRQLPGITKLLGARKPAPPGFGAATGFEHGILMTATTVFPSVTLAGHAAIFTGVDPGKHGITGNVMFDRTGRSKGGEPEFYPFTGAGSELSVLGPLYTYNQATANNALMTETIYQAMARRGRSSAVVHNMYFAGALWLSPAQADLGRFGESVAEEGWDYKYRPVLYDLAANKRGLAYLRKLSGQKLTERPSIVTFYYAGLDHFGHDSSGKPEANHAHYLPKLDKLIQEVVKQVTSSPVAGGLGAEGAVFLICSDHGHTYVGDKKVVTMDYFHRVYSMGHGYRLYGSNPFQSTTSLPDFSNQTSNICVALNGGMAHIYVMDEGDSWWPNSWRTPPSSKAVHRAAERLWQAKSEREQKALADERAIKLVLIRETENGRWNSPYKVYLGKGRTEDVATHLRNNGITMGWPAEKIPFLVERIQAISCERSGDILVLADNPSFYFEYEKLEGGDHGSLFPEDMQIPFLVAQPGASSTQVLGQAILSAMPGGDASAPRITDIAPTMARFCGEEFRAGAEKGENSPATPEPLYLMRNGEAAPNVGEMSVFRIPKLVAALNRSYKLKKKGGKLEAPPPSENKPSSRNSVPHPDATAARLHDAMPVLFANSSSQAPHTSPDSTAPVSAEAPEPVVVTVMGGPEGPTTLHLPNPASALHVTRAGVKATSSLPSWKLEAFNVKDERIAEFAEAGGADRRARTVTVTAVGIAYFRITTAPRLADGRTPTFDSLPVLDIKFDQTPESKATLKDEPAAILEWQALKQFREGKPAEGEPLLRKALAVRQARAQADPRDSHWREGWLATLAMIGSLHRFGEKPQEEFAEYDRQIGVAPAVLRLPLQIAKCDAYLAQKQLNEAVRSAESLTSERTTPVEIRFQLAHLFVGIADRLTKDAPSKAAAFDQRALSLLEECWQDKLFLAIGPKMLLASTPAFRRLHGEAAFKTLAKRIEDDEREPWNGTEPNVAQGTTQPTIGKTEGTRTFHFQQLTKFPAFRGSGVLIGGRGQDPVLSADGQWALYAARTIEGGAIKVCRLRIEDGKVEELLDLGQHEGPQLDLSADGATAMVCLDGKLQLFEKTMATVVEIDAPIRRAQLAGNGDKVYFMLSSDTVEAKSRKPFPRGLYCAARARSDDKENKERPAWEITQVVGQKEACKALEIDPAGASVLFGNGSSHPDLGVSADGRRAVCCIQVGDGPHGKQGYWALRYSADGVALVNLPPLWQLHHLGISGNGDWIDYRAILPANRGSQVGVVKWDNNQHKVVVKNDVIFRQVLTHDGKYLTLSRAAAVRAVHLESLAPMSFSIFAGSQVDQRDNTVIPLYDQAGLMGDRAGRRFLYVAYIAGAANLAIVDVQPQRQGVVVIGTPKILLKSEKSESEFRFEVPVAGKSLLHVGGMFVKDGQAAPKSFPFPLADDGKSLGDSKASDGVFTNSSVRAGFVPDDGSYSVRFIAEMRGEDGRHFALAVDVPLTDPMAAPSPRKTGP